MKTKNIFWGLFFILAAILLIMSQFGFLNGFSVWTILATLVLITVFVHSVVRISYFGIFLSLGALFLLYQDILLSVGFPWFTKGISSWVVIVTALFLSIGCSILFKRNKHAFSSSTNTRVIGSISDEKLDINIKFGSSAEYVRSQSFTDINIRISFGEGKIFFNDSTPSPGGAKANIDCSFGNCELYIPAGWNVINKLDPTMANLNFAVKDYIVGAPELTLCGEIKLGNLSVIYI